MRDVREKLHGWGEEHGRGGDGGSCEGLTTEEAPHNLERGPVLCLAGIGLGSSSASQRITSPKSKHEFSSRSQKMLQVSQYSTPHSVRIGGSSSRFLAVLVVKWGVGGPQCG